MRRASPLPFTPCAMIEHYINNPILAMLHLRSALCLVPLRSAASASPNETWKPLHVGYNARAGRLFLNHNGALALKFFFCARGCVWWTSSLSCCNRVMMDALAQ